VHFARTHPTYGSPGESNRAVESPGVLLGHAEAPRKRKLSVNAAARAIDVSRNTPQNWLNGDADADLRTFDRLSELTGLSHVLLLELAGVVPPELGPIAYQTQAAHELREGLRRVRRWVDQAIDVADSPPAAQVAGALLSRSREWEVTLIRRLLADTLVDTMVRLSIDALTAIHRDHNGPAPQRWLTLPGHPERSSGA
jgi:hypothetical protein